ncbi:MAG: sensor histidine kinase [bacterium]|nr:sensor histidine kinase [bacterium]
MTLVVMALALIMGTSESVHVLTMGDQKTLDVLGWLVWLVAAPAVAFMGQRVRPGLAPWGRIVLSHGLVASVFGAVVAVLCVHLPPILFDWGYLPADAIEGLSDDLPPGSPTVEVAVPGGWEPTDETSEEMVELSGPVVPTIAGPESGLWWLGPFVYGLLNYAVLVVVVMALQLNRDVRERQAAADRLEGQLGMAQLAALRMQVRPHFLFNTLNSIATLMPRDMAGARRMVNQLADLLRASFSETKSHEAPLGEDIELLRRYLDIQQVRFGEKLRVRLDIQADVHEALVPTFCLQPLVENAIVHGVGTRPELGVITIRACRDAEDLVIDVSDDGPGAADEELYDKGVGLRNTRDRLAQLYGERAEMTIESGATGGFTVRLCIPYHEKPMEPAEA